MTTTLRHTPKAATSALATATLIVAAGMLPPSPASAQTTIITREPVESRAVVVEQPLALTPSQRTTIYRTVRRQPVVTPAPTVEYRVGMRVPDTVELYSVPAPVVAEVPTVRSYKYMTVNNRVWLVDPATSQIVAEVAE